MQPMQRNSRASSFSSQQNAHVGGCVCSGAQSTFTRESNFLTRVAPVSSGGQKIHQDAMASSDHSVGEISVPHPTVPPAKHTHW